MESARNSDKKVTMICPNLSCRRTLSAPASARGQVMRCAYCRTPFRVPEAPRLESEPVAPERASGKG